jgi:nucleoside-diphosphate kinase
MQRTFAIIKPDAVGAGHIGEILAIIEREGFRIVGMKMLHMHRDQAEGFYAVHKGKPFYEGLVEFMISGPSVVLVLEREDAIARWREIMGPTDFKQAPKGTIRRQFASTVSHNAVHGSDAPETAAEEIPFFFASAELI